MNLHPSLVAITLVASSLLAAGVSLRPDNQPSNVEDEWFRAWRLASVTYSFPSQVRLRGTRFGDLDTIEFHATHIESVNGHSHKPLRCAHFILHCRPNVAPASRHLTTVFCRPRKIAVRRGTPSRRTIMQSQVSAGQIPTNAGIPLSLSPQLDPPLTERQMAELLEAWLEHQVNPLGEIQSRGVPYSALNE